MAIASIEVDTAEAMEKLRGLQAEADKAKNAMVLLKNAVGEAKEAMQRFAKACEEIDFPIEG